MRTLISADELRTGITSLARRLEAHYAGQPLTIVALLNGSLIFLADLVRELRIPVEYDTLRVSAYRGEATTAGEVRVEVGQVPPVRGRHVLLLMDSLTRYAMAQREIALAIGEPPATKGYPPSCFAKLPQLVERSGNGLNGVGSITAFYTVLSEGDDQQDPIADAARAILDGHIVLSRTLAEAGHYPAIDIGQSASRVMHNVVSREHFETARRFRAINARYEKGRDLVQIGAYVHGSDPALDEAIRLHAPMEEFLQQGMYEAASFDDSVQRMAATLELEEAFP